MSVSIKYKGNEIASMTESGTKTLQTKGKYCEDNITVTQTTPPPVEPNDITFWDYDGTVVAAWSLAEMAGKTALPDYPAHEGLICQGWNWTLADIKAANRELDIGALYITDDGKTRLYINFDKGTWDDFVLNYYQSAANAVVVDWGDGTTPEAMSPEGYTEHRHTYTSSGNYVITLLAVEGATMQLGGNGKLLIANNEDDIGRCSMLIKIEVGARVTTVADNSFRGCVRLTSATFPSTTKVNGGRTFEQCPQIRVIAVAMMDRVSQTAYQSANLRAISTPKGVTQTARYVTANTAVRQVNYDAISTYFSQSLERVHIAAVNGTVGDFSACRSLLEVTIPADATGFIGGAFSGCNSLRKVTCLGNIVNIPATTFQRCFPLRYIDLTHCTAVPTLENVNAFGYTSPQLEIRVPAALADEWKAATNWATYADQIVGV